MDRSDYIIKVVVQTCLEYPDLARGLLVDPDVELVRVRTVSVLLRME